ncbi:unnamed protein product [Fraxinus pennsylvanica]|uniref:Strictosidine synthase conserved region domain-containing protein n=1 Tax=Fraxinus pennsylvanica TaxID=56036 RepID=A0AAD1ZAI7_9LAMI|nr:unnamed protein product [Fraxinus pennsylvanica]
MDIRTCSAILLASALAIAFQVFVLSPISPDILLLPTSSIPSNSKLQEVSKLGEGLLNRPEAIAVDKTGVLYTATRDGWITRLHRNGSWEKWRHIDSDNLLGVTATAAGDLVVCDAEKGLLKVGEDGVTVLASHVNGAKILFADDVIESADGSLYFSIATTKYEPHNWHLEVLEAKSHGQLAKYDPSSKETSILLDNLAFANGVALSADQDYLVVCETWKFADDVIESADGSLYFSIATTKYEPHNWHLEVLEAKSHGQLAKYDPSSKETSILLDNLAFANGVALSADQDYLVVCETWKYRCLKYWLKEENRGQTEASPIHPAELLWLGNQT